MNELDEKLIKSMLEQYKKENESHLTLSPLINAIMVVLVENNICTGERLTELKDEFTKKAEQEVKDKIASEVNNMSDVAKKLSSAFI